MLSLQQTGSRGRKTSSRTRPEPWQRCATSSPCGCEWSARQLACHLRRERLHRAQPTRKSASHTTAFWDRIERPRRRSKTARLRRCARARQENAADRYRPSKVGEAFICTRQHASGVGTPFACASTEAFASLKQTSQRCGGACGAACSSKDLPAMLPRAEESVLPRYRHTKGTRSPRRDSRRGGDDPVSRNNAPPRAAQLLRGPVGSSQRRGKINDPRPQRMHTRPRRDVANATAMARRRRAKINVARRLPPASRGRRPSACPTGATTGRSVRVQGTSTLPKSQARRDRHPTPLSHATLSVGNSGAFVTFCLCCC